MRPPRFLVVLAGLLVAATAASAPIVPPVEPPPAVRAGASYVTLIPDLPAGVEECELILVLDDGSGRRIQLTPEREADEGPLRWRMPRVRAARARLVLRAGGEFGETESAPSAPFAIEAPGAHDLAEVLRGEDELAWQFGHEAAASDALRLPVGAATLDVAARAAVAVDPNRDASVAPPSPAADVAGSQQSPTEKAPPAPPTSRRPAFVPLRN